MEKDIAEAILGESGLSPSKLGLRFDRVVGRVLGDLRAFAEMASPADRTVLVTISAPIRLPGKTVTSLCEDIQRLLTAQAPGPERALRVHGNHVRLRVVEPAPGQRLRLVGFVHNPDSDPELLLRLAEAWVCGEGS